jgi:hypothetical protein
MNVHLAKMMKMTWLIFKAALGIKGTERVGGYGRFIVTEIAEKQFRAFLRDQGRRRAAQENSQAPRW